MGGNAIIVFHNISANKLRNFKENHIHRNIPFFFLVVATSKYMAIKYRLRELYALSLIQLAMPKKGINPVFKI